MRPRSRAMCALPLALVLLTTVSLASASAAKKPPPPPKPVCNLLTDDRDDGKSQVVPVIKSKPLDVIGGDVATGATTMVAVLRLASTDMNLASDPFSDSGYGWWISTESSLGQHYSFSASRDLLGNMTHKASVDGVGVQPGTLTFAIVGNTFVWTLKRSAAPNLARPRNVFSQVSAASEVLSSTADTAPPSFARYPDKAPSCVIAK